MASFKFDCKKFMRELEREIKNSVQRDVERYPEKVLNKHIGKHVSACCPRCGNFQMADGSACRRDSSLPCMRVQRSS